MDIILMVVMVPTLIWVLWMGWKINMRVIEKEIKYKAKKWDRKRDEVSR